MRELYTFGKHSCDVDSPQLCRRGKKRNPKPVAGLVRECATDPAISPAARSCQLIMREASRVPKKSDGPCWLQENGVSSEGKGIGESTFTFGGGNLAPLPITVVYQVGRFPNLWKIPSSWWPEHVAMFCQDCRWKGAVSKELLEDISRAAVGPAILIAP